ncbi:MAG: hypothetical protein WBA97_19000 [Actinophytocola sp.]|uniref:hypothetical protein n=1 Tax=Actinophytocola sp. TaxID=1872138 RepID=UPI003C75DFF7
MPIRIHDLLLALAGRLDDDALADARQMVASAELDRSLEFLAGCLAAGRIVLTRDQHTELESLFADMYLDPSVIDRVMVTDHVEAGRHRFAFGAVDGRDPERGVADAVRPVLGVLPDVRSMWCVWRLTPAGPASGAVPRLLVLVGIGPGGFPPATAYRVEEALRRAGIRASVEVLMDGVEPGDYHREAMRSARQVPFDGLGSTLPRVEPAYEAPRIESARTRVESARVEPPRMSAVPEPSRIESSRVEPPRLTAAPELPRRPEPAPEPPRLSAVQPEPPRVAAVRPETSRRDSLAHDVPRIDSPHVEIPVRKDPPFSDQSVFTEPHQEGPHVDPPTMMTPAAGGIEAKEPPRVDAVRSDPFEPPVPQPASQFEQERLPEDAQPMPVQPPSALHEEARTNSRPSPTPRRRAEPPKDEQPQEPPSRPRLAPANGVDKHSQAFVDDVLSTQERNLLRELQDELARREQQDPPPQSTASWHVDRSGRHGKPASAAPFDHPNQTTGPMIINGMPPHSDNRGYPPAN